MVLRPISAWQQLERRATIQSNLASQRMEGLEPDAEVLQDCEKWVRGEASIDDIVEIYKARLRASGAMSHVSKPLK
ncbi:antitoxin VbhA family protein [Acidovorax sp. BLS4]|uniref:antitoxin VbhA family protein n=1 Tax=Acidovorax sp. BLS4 TaxID=3273430 RepID=UPI0029435936|nr:antitoxin VbhA family protein [Paracidovorax avenae]WOI47106.1 antitoxin VbhA family protein [Paracidovorax avenae]